MPQAAQPPHFPTGSAFDHLRRFGILGVPLGEKLRVRRCEVVDALDGAASGTERAPNALHAGRDHRVPDMRRIGWADPPRLPAGLSGHRRRCQIAVQRRVPLVDQMGRDAGDVVPTLLHTCWHVTTLRRTSDRTLGGGVTVPQSCHSELNRGRRHASVNAYPNSVRGCSSVRIRRLLIGTAVLLVLLVTATSVVLTFGSQLGGRCPMTASITSVLSVATTFVSDILTGLVVAQATVALRG